MALIYASAIVERCSVVYCDVLSITLASDGAAFTTLSFLLVSSKKSRYNSVSMLLQNGV